MNQDEIRKRFNDFFKENGHKIIASSSLVPGDPSVLLTTAGMQQFKKYYTGELNPLSDFGIKNTASIQKCFRTSDIDEVGDESHLTFFEMMGNFSFGGYFKEEAIKYAHTFITEVMKLEISYVTVFEGFPSGKIPRDDESKKVWGSLGVNDIREQGMDDVFWGPTGNEGPCGPTTEIYCKNVEGKDIEIWNIVFNEFYCDRSREQLLKSPHNVTLSNLPFKGIDTGMGLERLSMISQNVPTIFDTDLFISFILLLPKTLPVRVKRIIADHGRAISFLIADGVRPSNKEAGYILRRLLRRIITHLYLAGDPVMLEKLLKEIINQYLSFYPELDEKIILEVVEEENFRFRKTLEIGLKELKRINVLDAVSAFKLYESFGLPYEIIKELGGENADGLNREEFEKEFKKHQEISRAGQEKKFGGHGLILNTGELKAGDEEELKKVTRLHTATHLLHKALREVLGNDVHQMGSDITVERTRFDFNFPRKLTPEELQKIESIVNDKIKENLSVAYKELTKKEAENTGALYYFKEKYPEIVKVYYVGSSLQDAWSKEFCGGPHVQNTNEIRAFKILKEEAVGSGVRRIRATIE